MNVLGLIPARGGSKGIPRKNLADVAGRPLLEWSCRAALASSCLSRVIVSTDDPEIAEAAKSFGAETPFLRPVDLAEDDTPMLPVVLHALERVGGADAVVLLQPTSPLRTSKHIEGAVRLWEESRADSVVSVVRIPHNLTPSSLLRTVEGRLEPYLPGGSTRRQDKDVLFARNGPAVVVTAAHIVQAGSLYGEHCRGYEMTPQDSVDVDTPFDLEVAEWLLRRRDESR